MTSFVEIIRFNKVKCYYINGDKMNINTVNNIFNEMLKDVKYLKIKSNIIQINSCSKKK